MGYEPIENYGLIGDLSSVALVGMNGSIDYMCFPEFDSPSIFAALLDDKKGGSFQITPSLPGARQKQSYLPDSAILRTRFLCPGGVAEISDFMVIGKKGSPQALIRRVKALRGEISFRMVCHPRFDYGRQEHTVILGKEEATFFPSSPELVPIRLWSSLPLQEQEGAAVADFALSVGQKAYFILETAGPAEKPSVPISEYVVSSFKETVNFWSHWVSKSHYKGKWREEVQRSAITLKLLTSRKYGSIVAAPTFSLPEEIGGSRNWDYRFTWIRDASFTLYALIRLGHIEEAADFMKWITDRCNELTPSGSLQPMYSLSGGPVPLEQTLPNLEGYRRSSPVRIGNAAHSQLQLDIYGELMDSIYLYNKYGEPISYDLWKNLIPLLDYVCLNWRNKDEGIWEVRDGQHDFLYSKLMCWVALDRGIRIAKRRSFPGPTDRWRQERNAIYLEIFEGYWSEKKKAFVQKKGSEELDASVLLMPLVQFISPTDPKWLSTLEAVEKELTDDSHVYRYKNHDGLDGKEGTFNMCSFWFVECLARAGDVRKAELLFEKMLSYSNHLGLFAEEIGLSGEQLGNFPQAFVHLSLISAAVNIDYQLSKH